MRYESLTPWHSSPRQRKESRRGFQILGFSPNGSKSVDHASLACSAARKAFEPDGCERISQTEHVKALSTLWIGLKQTASANLEASRRSCSGRPQSTSLLKADEPLNLSLLDMKRFAFKPIHPRGSQEEWHISLKLKLLTRCFLKRPSLVGRPAPQLDGTCTGLEGSTLCALGFPNASHA